jgi:hypothetical protein
VFKGREQVVTGLHALFRDREHDCDGQPSV